MAYQCADCGLPSETPFEAVYQHGVVAMVIMRCPECAARWDSEVEPVLDSVVGNYRSKKRQRR